MVVIAAGAGANAFTIAINGGTLPASSWALRHAGIQSRAGFDNSGIVRHPHLAWLGDIMVTPSWLPLRNMVSIGDLVLLAGAIILVARVSRTAPDEDAPEHVWNPQALTFALGSAGAVDQSTAAMNIREPGGAIAA
jgi:hypothetical protein